MDKRKWSRNKARSRLMMKDGELKLDAAIALSAKPLRARQ